jgi:hypothetical protein
MSRRMCRLVDVSGGIEFAPFLGEAAKVGTADRPNAAQEMAQECHE